MTLTEQLKKGELEQGYYYMQIPTGDIRIITECMKVDCKGFSILSKVPSYEEWKSTGKFAMEAIKVAQENQQLKEKLEKAEATLLDIDGGWVTDEIRSKISEYFVHAIGEKK